MRTLPLALVAVATLGGCAGGNEDEFPQRAAAICKEKQAQVGKIRPPGALILFEDYLTKVLPTLREQHEKVGALDGADSGDAERMLDAWDDVLAGLEGMHEAAKSGSDIGIALGLRRAAAAEREADQAARELGLEECAGFNPITRG